MRISTLTPRLVPLVALLCAAAVHAADPLPSWNDGPSKQSIVRFVEQVTAKGSASFVPPAERVATFDNDGTLWGEQPMYVQGFFINDRIKALAPQHPEWQTQEPFASVLKGDLKSALSGGAHAVVEMAMTTHAGMTTVEFDKIVTDWITTAKHPQTGRLYTEMVYQPMLELINYLKDNAFKVYIVSGGGVEFMRPWTERVYGIPPEHVIGSSIVTKFDLRDGKPVLTRLPKVDFIEGRASRLASRCGSGDVRSPPLAIRTATCRCSNGQRQEQDRDSACTFTTPTRRASGLTIAKAASGAWTRA
jgi:phosphoglycolate phosphatase-like HAD superfamily hydrolase